MGLQLDALLAKKGFKFMFCKVGSVGSVECSPPVGNKWIFSKKLGPDSEFKLEFGIVEYLPLVGNE